MHRMSELDKKVRSDIFDNQNRIGLVGYVVFILINRNFNYTYEFVVSYSKLVERSQKMLSAQEKANLYLQKSNGARISLFYIVTCFIVRWLLMCFRLLVDAVSCYCFYTAVE